MRLWKICSVLIWRLFLLLIFASLAGSLYVFYIFSASLPDHTSLKNYVPSVSSRVYLQNGEKLCEYTSEKRYFIPIDRVPQKLINAFVAVEDKHFFSHIGVDIFGIIRSVIKNVDNYIYGNGKRPQGASTITQQVARIFLIKNNRISYARKIEEALLSFKIESTLSKKQILELYLNQIFLGLGCYGVAAAAKAYFNKTVDELSIAECAYLAALAKGANNYHPEKNKKQAITRRNWAIGRQLEDGYITKQEAEMALREDLVMATETTPAVAAEYFAEEIRKDLIEKYSLENLNKEGLIIRATLDVKLQKCAERALRKELELLDRVFGWRGAMATINIERRCDEIVANLGEIASPRGSEAFNRAVVMTTKGNEATILNENGEQGNLLETDVKWSGVKPGDVILVAPVDRKPRNAKTNGKNTFTIKQLPIIQGAIVVVEVETGRILAMHGGYSFRQSEFNRVTSAMRQTGSAFKPFVYLAALENGFAPNTVIDASNVEENLGKKLGIWKPKNYGDAAIEKITLRCAIERSVNTATVRIAQEVGLKKIAQLSEKFGIFEKMPELMSYALGAGESTLLTMTIAYAMLANGGKKIMPTLVDCIYDKHGRILYKSDHRIIDGNICFDALLPPKLEDNRQQIVNERSVYQITSLLEGVMTRGSGAMARSLNITVAGKTGTSNDSRDVWFIGYTPDIALGVFIGFDDHSRSLGRKATGSSIALPVFIDFMSEAKKYFTQKPFRVPKGIKLRKINAETGGAPSQNPLENIIESFKDDAEEKEINVIESNRGTQNGIMAQKANIRSVTDEITVAGVEEKQSGNVIIDVATEPAKRRSLSHFTNEVLDDMTREQEDDDGIVVNDKVSDAAIRSSMSRIQSTDDQFPDGGNQFMDTAKEAANDDNSRSSGNDDQRTSEDDLINDQENANDDANNHDDSDSPKISPVFGVY
ncbi:MAG: PBP1A family penicillin-binding protein [Holosporaceae bacterium]|jgi:penicillin-binding protein 1A|nr:PBP1A family penicillin-binding protein [Holosporaceae bacterium]